MATQKKFSRKDLKRPDEFISSTDQFINYCRANKSLILFLVVGVFIVVGGAGLFLKNQKIQSLRMESLLYEMKKMKVGEDGLEKLAGYLVEFNEGTHKNRARMILADAYFQKKKNGDAIKIYEKVLQKTGPKGLIRDLAQLGLAQTYEQVKNSKQAIAVYKSLIKGKNSLPLFQIYFSMVSIYEREKDYKNALLTLREMENQFKEHAQYDQVSDKIHELEKLARF